MEPQDTDKLEPIKVVFDKPRHGFWEGGAKSSGEFTADAIKQDAQGYYVKWGSWGLNFWFHAAYGKSHKTAKANAIKKLKSMLRCPATIS